MLLKLEQLREQYRAVWAFSTLYRVDAIEAQRHDHGGGRDSVFQYPLSGRCY